VERREQPIFSIYFRERIKNVAFSVVRKHSGSLHLRFATLRVHCEQLLGVWLHLRFANKRSP